RTPPSRLRAEQDSTDAASPPIGNDGEQLYEATGRGDEADQHVVLEGTHDATVARTVVAEQLLLPHDVDAIVGQGAHEQAPRGADHRRIALDRLQADRHASTVPPSAIGANFRGMRIAVLRTGYV